MKKNIKGFTLIELLVVVAIIGILAAVGVVAYNGYTQSAKANAVKTVGAQAQKYMQAEITKCTLDSNATVLGNVSCSNITGGSGATNAVNAMVALTDKSPVFTGQPVYKTGTQADYGYVVLEARNSDKEIKIRTCWKENCGADNKSLTTVTIE